MQITTQDIVLITIVISVSIVVLLSFLFVIAIRIFRINRKKQKEIFIAVLNAQEKERQRIANDLHDHIVPLLSAIKLNIGQLEKKETDEKLHESVAEIKEYLDSSITDIRHISHNLVPKRISEQGLVGSLEEYVRTIKKPGSVEINFIHNISKLGFDKMTETSLYRIIQELINNSILHGKATSINIEIILNQNELSIYVGDNGKGFDQTTENCSGIGTKSIASRVELFGGRYEWESTEGMGTQFKAVFDTKKFD